MTRTPHTSHPTPAFPVYCLAFVDKTHLLLGGGGGASRTGVKNKLKLALTPPNGQSLIPLTSYEFPPEEDAPWSLSIDYSAKKFVVGVNASESTVKEGKNEHCRVFEYGEAVALAGKGEGEGKKRKGEVEGGGEGNLEFVKGVQTIDEKWSDDYPYQRFTCLAPTAPPHLLALGTISSSSQTVTVLTYPGLEKVEGGEVKIPIEGGTGGEEKKDGDVGGEMVDLDWSGDGAWLAITTTTGISLYSVSLPTSTTTTTTTHTTSSKTLTYRQTISPPPSLSTEPTLFRSAKFSRHPLPGAPLMIHAVLNNPQPKPVPRGLRGGGKNAKGKGAGQVQRAWVVNFGLEAGGVEGLKGKEKEGQAEEMGRWDVLVKREVGTKPITVFETSSDGRLLAYASSDYSIGILDARTLAPLLKILHAHKFATTALAFNPDATMLASASADQTIRLIVVPASFGSTSTTLLAMLIALILVIIAILVQRRIVQS